MSTRVLLVDDQELVRTGFRLILNAEADLDVVGEAGDGAEAVEAARRTPYAAILMDCQMPRMDGYAASRLIREREQPGARIPIIALTADVVTDARAKSLAAGMDDFVTKPINPEELAATLERWAPVAPRADAGVAPGAAARTGANATTRAAGGGSARPIGARQASRS